MQRALSMLITLLAALSTSLSSNSSESLANSLSVALPDAQTRAGRCDGAEVEEQTVAKSEQQLEKRLQPLLHWHAKALLYRAPHFPLQEFKEEGQELLWASNLVFSLSSSLILCSRLSQA